MHVCVCVWHRLRERGMSTQCANCLDLCFSMIPSPNNVSWEKRKKSVSAAKFVDSLLKISKTEQEMTRLFSFLVCSVSACSFACTKTAPLLLKHCWIYNLSLSTMELGEWIWLKTLYLKGQSSALTEFSFSNYWVHCLSLFRHRC